jgi:hypothetical protein
MINGIDRSSSATFDDLGQRPYDRHRPRLICTRNLTDETD